jgi:hypothetical protein
MKGDMNRTEVLKMVESGQLSAAEAMAKLSTPKKPSLKLTTPEGQRRWFHVRVTNLDTGQPQVTVNLPMSLVQVGLSIGSRFAPEIDGLDWQTIANALNDETTGRIVEVEDLEEGKRVEVYVE